ncbi:MAG TPA: hypothetical protein VN958_03615, partial [Chitinophagaceae bacterium]|nr:hypothetical protein [Chitinophagaceae bacterium]
KDLLAHVAGTYFYWLTSFAQNKKLPIFDAKIENNIKEIKALYNEVDNSVMHFIRHVNDDWIKPVTVKIED